MRRVSFMLVAILGLLFSTVGCSANSKVKVGDRTLTGPEFNQYLVQHESQVRLGSSLATRIVLASAVSPDDQANFKKAAADVATTVDGLVASDQPDLTGVRTLVASRIALSNLKNKTLLTELAGSITDIVQSYLNTTYKDADPDSRRAAARALLRGAARGVLDVCRPELSQAVEDQWRFRHVLERQQVMLS